MGQARFKPDELYRLVYTREDGDEPDWDTLNVRYKRRIAYILEAPHAIAVHPYSAGKYYVAQVIDKIYAGRDEEGERLPDGSDPSLVCYGDDVVTCD